MTPLSGWENFYVIVGSAAAALIGLQFVAMAIAANVRTRSASSETVDAFGTPNIPRIRGQYADVFYNGMRSSFTDNGYGVPLNFDAFDNIAITKGPASVIDGPGAGEEEPFVGGTCFVDRDRT